MKHISEIQIGEFYKHLPSGEIKKFEKEDDIAWDVINQDNYKVVDPPLSSQHENARAAAEKQKQQ